MPKVVIGIPLYNRDKYLAKAIDSLLAQTYTDFALVLVDDASTDQTSDVAQRYVRHDPRVSYRRNHQRLGMARNWRTTFLVARALHPDAVYFAWGSDHDVWEPGWLGALVDELDHHPEAVLAYPLSKRISADGRALRGPWRFATTGLHWRFRRFWRTCLGMVPADMVYGLFRVNALEQAGIFRPVLLADRLLIAEMSLYGQFRQVPSVLWHRRFRRLMTMQRQRASFYPDGPPWHAYLPWWLLHTMALAWHLGVCGFGKPSVGRAEGFFFALLYCLLGLVVELRSVLRRAITYGVRKPLRMPVHRLRKRLLAVRARCYRRLLHPLTLSLSRARERRHRRNYSAERDAQS